MDNQYLIFLYVLDFFFACTCTHTHVCTWCDHELQLCRGLETGRIQQCSVLPEPLKKTTIHCKREVSTTPVPKKRGWSFMKHYDGIILTAIAAKKNQTQALKEFSCKNHNDIHWTCEEDISVAPHFLAFTKAFHEIHSGVKLRDIASLWYSWRNYE